MLYGTCVGLIIINNFLSSFERNKNLKIKIFNVLIYITLRKYTYMGYLRMFAPLFVSRGCESFYNLSCKHNICRKKLWINLLVFGV